MKPEQNHFTCRTYKKDGAEVCSAHYIREVALKEIVLETIRRATEFARSDPERFAAYIQQSNLLRWQRRSGGWNGNCPRCGNGMANWM